MASQIQSRWVYPLVGLTTQKTLPRVTTDTRAAFELTGVDGSLRGGIRPFPGFLKAHTFMAEGEGFIRDYVLFELRLDADSAAHGVAYIKGDAVHVDINFPIGGWKTQVVHASNANGPLDCVSWGKVVYVFCRGLPPVAIRGFRNEESDQVGVISPAGPGDPPRALLGSVPADDEGQAEGLALRLGVGGGVSLASGNYAFAYSFYDSRTGRRSQLSEIVELTGESFSGSSSLAWSWYTGTAPADSHAAVPPSFKDKWDRVYVWRSVRVEGAGGTYVAAILHLDKVYPMFHGEDDSIVYPYTLKDVELVSQDVRLDRSSLYPTMPRGGTAALLNDVLYMADIVPDPVDETDNEDGTTTVTSEVYPNEAQQGVGEIRWSQPLDPHPELFHWSGRHMSSTVTERPLRLMAVGEAVIGMSRNRAMVVRRQGSIVLVDEIHEGYGLAGRNGCAALSDSVWFISDKGLKKVSVTGVLADVPILDELVVQNWGDTVSQCELSFDHRAGCLWILNPLKNKAVLLWMETGMLTELEELPFTAVRSGMWPNANEINIRRALFLKGDSLWIADHDREDSQIRLLKVPGECEVVVESVVGDVVTVSPHIDAPVAVEAGMWVHGDGKKWFVWGVVGPRSFRLIAEGGSGQLPAAGSLLTLSPVVLRWSGGTLSGQTEEGMAFLGSGDMFRSRQLSSVGCVFDAVEGVGEFRACAFYGTSIEPSHYGTPVEIKDMGGLPTDYSAFGTYGVSHSSLSPGVEVLCADLDFRLLSVLCRGRVDASDRAR